MSTQTARREKIRIQDIEISGEVMPRWSTDYETVEAYHEAYEAGEALPPVVVFADDHPGRCWLADGWHRLDAQMYEDDDGAIDVTAEVEPEIHSGGKLAAMFFAAGANLTHGRRRDRYDAIAAAKVAIRALSLQNPERRPTIEAVKETAHVGSEIAQRAFRDLEEEQARVAAVETQLPPKDPRGGRRESFVPRGTNPLDTLERTADRPTMLHEVVEARPYEVRTIVTTVEAPVQVRGVDQRALAAQRQAREFLRPLAELQSALERVRGLAPDQALRSWAAVPQPQPLVTVLREIAAEVSHYADAIAGAEEAVQRPPVRLVPRDVVDAS